MNAHLVLLEKFVHKLVLLHQIKIVMPVSIAQKVLYFQDQQNHQLLVDQDVV